MALEQPRVFISYQRTDEAVASQVREQLVAHGVRTWMDQFDIPVGAYWADEIDRALATADTVVGLLSPDAVESRNVKNEWDWAIANHKRLVLLQVEPCVIPHRYIAINFIDATAPDRTHALAALVDALGITAPPEAPTEPAGPSAPVRAPAPAAGPARQELICVACGAELASGARFCHQCAAPVTTPAAPPTPRAAPALPTAFVNGRYAVARFLGEGGKKRVYQCHDTILDREVAFALIKTEGLDAIGVERVRREAKVMARLGDHPHIVSLYDIGDEAGQPYLVSQLMSGGDVERLVAQAPEHRLPLEQTLRIADQVLQALAYAHDHGIIHRDLKPGNVWLTKDGTAKLGDFGLAMAIDKTRLSLAGMIVGTVAYMPPEQALGRAPDARSDLYALGTMLYELVTGRPPFLGDDPVAIIGQHLNTAPVAPSWHNPQVPKLLERLILQLLAKDPADRPHSAAVVREALAQISAVSTQPSSTELAAQAEANPLDRLASGVFVGRSREMTALRAGLDATLSGQSQILLLAGDPGIGKTRLAEELATYATLRGAQVLWGRCYEWEGAPAYWPWVQLIRGYVHDRDAQVLRSELGSGASDIAQVVSEIRERLPDVTRPPAMEPEQARFRFFDSIATFLTNAATHQPLVLILDDLHWADKSSLLLLEFLAREIRAARLLLIGTYRDVEIGRQHPLSQTLAELSRERRSQRIVLRGLLQEDVAQFIALTAGGTPPTGLVGAVHQETEGNPFFVAEVVRLLAVEGRLTRPEAGRSWSVSIPESVREVIGRRLSRLSEECNRVLTIGSVVGREFRLATLERASGLSADQLLELLEEAIRGRVVEEQDAVGHYRFSHTLIQETLYDELSTARRVRLHGQVGDAIEQLHAANLAPYVGELAQHYFQAAPVGFVDKAISYGVQAAERAMSQFAWEAAAGYYQQALQALSVQQPTDNAQQCEFLLAIGAAQWSAGDAAAAQDAAQQAIELARSLRRPDLLACAIFGMTGEDIVSVVFSDETRSHLLQEALDAVGPDDHVLRVKLLCKLIGFLPAGPDAIERKRRLADEAVMMARRLNDTRTQLLALRAKWRTLLDPATYADRRGLADEVIQLAEAIGDRSLIIEGYADRSVDWIEVGDVAAADRDVAVATRIIDELRLPTYTMFALMYRTVRALMEGRYQEVEGLMEQALVIGRRAWPSDVAEANIALYEHLLRREQARFDRAEAVSRNAMSRDPGLEVFWRVQVALLQTDQGNWDQAEIAFEGFATQGFANVIRDEMWLTTIALLGELAATLPAARPAATLYDLLRPYHDRVTHMGSQCMCYGPVSQYLGLLATSLGRWDDAARHYDDALAINTRMGARAFVTHTQYAWAEMLLRRGESADRRRALELAGQAHETAEELGMTRLAEKASAVTLRVERREPPMRL